MENIMVTRAGLPEFEEYIEEIKDLWDSHWITNMGQKHKKLEQALLDYLSLDNISLFTNGHLALELLIQAMALTGEVITTPFTFVSTTHAIVRNKLTPVFCDIREDNYTIDADKIEQLITPKTTAIVPVHVYGNICDVEKIAEIARIYDLKVIYDAAHAFGESYKGISIGNFGEASVFSFHATKVFNTIEGGAATFREKMIGEKLYKLKNFGIASEEIVNGVGLNAKMNEFQAAMGLCNLRHLDSNMEERKHRVMRYRDNLSSIAGIKICEYPEDVESNYAYFPVIIDEQEYGCTRNEVYDELRKNHIFARKYFYPLTNSLTCYKGQFDVQQTPAAKHISERVLTLPLYPDLAIEDVDRICDILKQFKK